MKFFMVKFFHRYPTLPRQAIDNIFFELYKVEQKER